MQLSPKKKKSNLGTGSDKLWAKEAKRELTFILQPSEKQRPCSKAQYLRVSAVALLETVVPPGPPLPEPDVQLVRRPGDPAADPEDHHQDAAQVAHTPVTNLNNKLFFFFSKLKQ